MSVKPSSERVENYDLKFNSEVIKQQIDRRRERMLAKQQEAQAAICAMETKCRELLGAMGVQTHLYIAYLNFCREVWKKARRFSGRTLEQEAMVIQGKWEARELKPEVMDRLRHEVFTLSDSK